MLSTVLLLVSAVLGFFAAPAETAVTIAPTCVNAQTRNAPAAAVLNPGLYATTSLTSNDCRDQCWRQFQSWTALITSFNLCLCGGYLTVANYSVTSGCSAPCVGSSCSAVSTVVNVSSPANMYVTKEGVTSVSLNIAAALPTSFSFMKPAITWQYLNQDYNTHSVGVSAYVDADLQTLSSVNSTGNSATFDLPTLKPGYHSVTSTLVDSDGAMYSRNDVAFVRLVTNSINFVLPPYAYVNESFPVLVRVGELMQSNITVTGCSGTNGSQLILNGQQVLETKSYSIGDLSAKASALLLANYVYLLPFYTITEEVTLEQVRVNALNSSSVMLQIYRPLCANSTVYCYSLNTCLSSGLACPQAGVPKVNCSGNLIYKLSARACFDYSSQTVQRSPVGTRLFTSYFFFFETVLTINRGGYLTANNATSATSRVTLLPGDIPAVMTTAPNVLSYNSNTAFSIFFATNNFNVFARATGYVAGAGNPSVNVNMAALSVNYTSSIPAVELTFTKPAYFLQNYTVYQNTCQSASCNAAFNCSLSAQVANSFSATNVSASIAIFTEITNLIMSGPPVAPSFQSINFLANSVGTLPNYAFTVNDSVSPGPWNLQGNDTFYLIPFSHYFVASGVYSVTVNASNFRSSNQYSKVIRILNPVADLSVWPVEIPGVTLGKASQFIVTLSQATAASVTIDYGDGTSDTAQVDDIGASASTNITDFFAVIPNGLYQSAPQTSATGMSLAACLDQCLSSFWCIMVAYDSYLINCSIYQSAAHFNASFVQRSAGSNRTFYVLKNDACSTDPTVAVGRPFSWNATSALDPAANISSNGAGWIASSPTNQSLQINFAAPTKIFFVQLFLTAAYNKKTKNYSMLASNDSFTWTPVSIIATNSSFSIPSGVIARFLQFTTLPNDVGGTDPASASVGIINCGLQTIKLVFTHTYSSDGNYKVVVNASNTISSMLATTTQHINRMVNNLSINTSTLGAVPVNATLNFTLTGQWGDPITITITRNDSVTLVNDFQSTILNSSDSNETSFQSMFNYSLQFEKPGFYVVTATVAGTINVDSAVSNVIVVDYRVPNISLVGLATGRFTSGSSSTLSPLLVCIPTGSPIPTMATTYVTYGSNASTPTFSGGFNCSSSLSTNYSCPVGYSACNVIPGTSYNAPGVKSIVLTVSGVLNSVVSTFDHTLWESVSSPQIKVKVLPPLPQGMNVFTSCLPAFTILEFSAILATGFNSQVNYTWNFGDGSALVNTNNASINYTYTNGSRGVLRLTAANPVSSVNTTIVQTMQGATLTPYCVMVPLSSSAISFSNDGPVEVNSTINFTFSLTGFPVAYSCYVIDFADPLFPNTGYVMWGNFSECTSLPQFSSYLGLSTIYSYSEQALYNALPLVYSHAYYKIARSTATLKAGNKVSFVTLSSPVVIVKLSCSLPRVSIQSSLKCTSSDNCDSTYGIEVIKFWRSKAVHFTSNVTIKCAATNAAFFDWTIGSCSDSSCTNVTILTNNDFAESIRRYNATPSLTGFYLRTISLLPRSLPYGLYQVCLNVSMFDQDGVWTQDCGLFSVVYTPTVTSCINNYAPVITGRFNDDTFKLEGSCSNDPDLWPDQDQALDFEWSCYRSCESTPKFNQPDGSFNNWDESTNPYSTNCSETLANSKLVSSKGCFAPFKVHESGPISNHAFSDWQSTDVKLNPLYNDPLSNDDYVTASQKVFLWYTPTNSSIILNTGTMFYKVQHIFLLSVRKKSAPWRWTQSSAIVSFLDVLPPQCSVVCVSNCYAAVQSFPNDPAIVIDPASAFKITGLIKNYSPLISYTFSWNLIYMPNLLTLVDFSKILASPANRSFAYDFSAHSSTLNDKIGLSLDKKFPIMKPEFWGKTIMFVLSITGQDVTGVTYILAQVNAPPMTEFCMASTSPSSGIALSTQFELACSCNLPTTKTYKYSLGFAVGVKNSFSNYNTMLTSSSSCVWLLSSSYLCSFTDGVVLPAGDEKNNNTVTICVAVADAVGSTNYTFIPLPVVRYDVKSSQIALATLANSSNLNSIMQKNPTTGMALVMAASTYILSGNTTASQTKTTSAQVQNFTKNVVVAISTISFESAGLQIITQASQVLTRFTADPNTVSSSTVPLVVNTLSNMASSLCSASLISSTSYNQLMSSASSVFTTTSQVAAATQTSITNSSNATAQTSASTTSDQKETYATLQRTLSYLSDAIKNVKVVDEGVTQLISQSLSMTVQTKSSALLGQTIVKLGGSESCTSFEFGSSDGVLAKSLNDTPQSVFFQHTSSPSSLFIWQPLASSINGETSMSLYQTTGNSTEIDVSSTPEKSQFIIWIDTELSTSSVSAAYSANKTLPFTRPTTQKMITHNVTVNAQSALFVSVRQYFAVATPSPSPVANFSNSSSGFDANTSSNTGNTVLSTLNDTYNGTNIRFLVYVTSKPAGPTDTDYQFSCMLPIIDPAELFCGRETDWNQQASDAASQVEARVKTTGASWLKNLTAESSNGDRCYRYPNRARDPYTCMFSESLLNVTKEKVFYFGIRAVIWNATFNFSNLYSANSTDNVTKPAAVPLTTAVPTHYVYVPVSYIFFAYSSACYFYNTTTDAFDTSGCTVGGCSSLYATQCLCKHLTSFANVFSMPPIKFDVTAVNLNALNDSPGVTLFLVVIMCTYCIVWIWARRKDLDDRQTVGVVPLPSNNDKDYFAYEITVWTGHMTGSGTSARVSCVLTGDETETRPRYLYNVKCNAFSRGSQRTMLLTTPVWLGELSHIRIWHDNTGDNPAWYFSRMLIRDLKTNCKYYFLVNSWLAVDRGSGVIEKLVPIAGKEELRGFEHVFWTRSTKQMLDGHMWLSVVTRPVRSRFTRVQRLTCCLMMCCLSILFNLLGFIVKNANTAANTSSSSYDGVLFSLGPVKITAWTMTIACIAAAVTVPVNIIVLLLFKERSVRVKQVCEDYEGLYTKYKDDQNSEFKSASGLATSANATIKYKQSNAEDEDTKSCCESALDAVSRSLGTVLRAVFPLPWFTHVIAYVIVLIVVGVCWFCVLVLAYSNLTSSQMDNWLQAIALSLVVDIVIVQPLQIVAIVTLFAFILREPVNDEESLAQEVTLMAIGKDSESEAATENLEMRIKSWKNLDPPDRAIVEGLRQKVLDESKTERALLSILGFVLLISLLFAAVYANVPASAYIQTNKVRQSTVPITAILDMQNAYAYVATQWLPFLHFETSKAYVGTQLNGDATRSNFINLPKFAADSMFYVLASRLRQVRVAPSSRCIVPDMLKSVVSYCTGETSASKTDSADYAPGWMALTSYRNESNTSNIERAFRYKGANAFLASTVSLVGAYPISSGYSVDFNGNMSFCLKILQDLKTSQWLDNGTRVLFFELLLYNIQTKLFTASTSFIEFSNGVRYRSVAQTLYLDWFSSSVGLAWLLELIAAAAIVIYNAVVIYNACKAKKRNSFSGWNCLDWAITIFSVLAVAVTIGFYVSSQVLLTSIKQSFEVYAQTEFVASLLRASYALLGLLVFLLTMRLLKLLLLSARFAVIGKTMGLLATMAFNFLTQVFALVLTFAFALFLVCNSVDFEYSTITRALVTTCSLLSGRALQASQLIGVMPVIAALLFVAYVFVVVMVFMRAAVCLLRASWHTNKKDSLAVSKTNDVLSYVAWKAREVWCWNLPGGTDESDGFEYIYGETQIEQTLIQFQEKADDMLLQFHEVVQQDRALKLKASADNKLSTSSIIS